MFCFDIFLPFEYFTGLNIIHSGGVWISGVSGGSTVSTQESGSNTRLFLSPPLQHFILRTHMRTHSEARITMLKEVSIADGHELNTAYVGILKTMEGTNAVKTNACFKTSTVGSRVMLLQRQQSPLSAECSSRGGGGVEVKALTALSILSQTSILIFSVQ